MQEFPDLSELSHADKDELIKVLWQQVHQLTVQVEAIREGAAQLKGRLQLNSQNSSKPPSSDGLNKPKPKSLRKGGQRPTGGQKGHSGSTLRQVAQADEVIDHAPPLQCDHCRRSLVAATATVSEVRQVFDLPPLRMQVTQHQVLQSQCTCGKTHRGQFPADVTTSVQYGPSALAAMVYLNQHHMLPVQRTAGLMSDLFDLPVSQGTVIKASEDARHRLTPVVQAIAQQIKESPVAHADESGLRVNKSLHWLHIAATETLTWMARHAKRGKEAFDALGILADFHGTLIHDGWKPYRALACTHGLCNAHHLRELTYVFEELKQPWAGKMIELLTRANAIDRDHCASKQAASNAQSYAAQVQRQRAQYQTILDQGDAANPRAPASGKRGATKQSKAANLLQRLRDHADDVWRFTTDPAVPFTNNVAEQAVRMPKVKQKISGCFRTTEGADTFCIIRSYLATMHKQGAKLFDSLVHTFRGAPPRPRFT